MPMTRNMYQHSHSNYFTQQKRFNNFKVKLILFKL